MDSYERLREKGIILPVSPGAGGLYALMNHVGNLYFTSGTGCKKEGKFLHVGQVGGELTIEQGQEAARMCILNLLSNMERELGDLKRVQKIVKMLGFVSSADHFGQQPKVMDAASRLLIDVFGEEAGCCARSAIGTNNLPGNQAVEIELIFEAN